MFLLCAKNSLPYHIACIVEQGKNLIFCLSCVRLQTFDRIVHTTLYLPLVGQTVYRLIFYELEYIVHYQILKCNELAHQTHLYCIDKEHSCYGIFGVLFVIIIICRGIECCTPYLLFSCHNYFSFPFFISSIT